MEYRERDSGEFPFLEMLLFDSRFLGIMCNEVAGVESEKGDENMYSVMKKLVTMRL